ncbi:MAG: DUF4352 domain-containing protein, partial [Colwellia sp.]
ALCHNKLNKVVVMIKILTTSILFLLVSACSSFQKYPVENLGDLSTKDIEIEVSHFNSGNRYTNYYLGVSIKNKTDNELFFDSSEFELIDTESGISYYSISRDLSELKLNNYSLSVITSTKLKPNRKVDGYILFPTGYEKANANGLDLLFKGKKVNLSL